MPTKPFAVVHETGSGTEAPIREVFNPKSEEKADVVANVAAAIREDLW